MTYFSNNYEIKYTFKQQLCKRMLCTETFSKLLQTIACRNIDILFRSSYKTRAMHKSKYILVTFVRL